MADVAWITLKVWPWQDEWLEQDEELADTFHGLGFMDDGVRGGTGQKIAGAMNGYAEDDAETGGLMICGEMSGGSYQIQEESSLLEQLRERGIAYALYGDAKYEWDGDETWWHPGMAKPFHATSTENGRVLTEHDYRAMIFRSLAPAEKLAEVGGLIAELRRKIRETKGTPIEAIHRTALGELLRSRDRIVRRRRSEEPVPLAEQLAAFFDPDPLAWKPGPRYRPRLKTETEEGVPA